MISQENILNLNFNWTKIRQEKNMCKNEDESKIIDFLK